MPAYAKPQSLSSECKQILTSDSPGEQHSNVANPFEEPKQRISEFTAIEIATLQSRLEKQLGPEYISDRPGPGGGKIHYIATEKSIALANEIFGFNGWSSSIQNIQVDFVDENPQTLRISLGLSVIVRVTLRDGTFHEDIGYGHVENAKGKAAAFEQAKKGATSDGLKRALRNFGNVLGNCIYDKEYMKKVTKLKVAPTKFDENNLHRHPDYAKKEQDVKVEQKFEAEKNAETSLVLNESVENSLDEEFEEMGMADFGVIEADEVILPGSNTTASTEKPQPAASTNSVPGPPRQMHPPSRPPVRGGPNGGLPAPRQQPQTPNQAGNRPAPPNQGRPNLQQNGKVSQPTNGPVSAVQQAGANSRSNTPPPANGESSGPGFFSARSVKPLAEDAQAGATPMVPNGAKPFDPHFESPSIRRTPGFDHKSSKPVARNGNQVKIVAPVKRDDEPQRPNVGNTNMSNNHGNGPAHGPGRPIVGNPINPSLNPTRQIGAPRVNSPMGNTSQYRPPTMKRPAPGMNNSARPPLQERTTNGHVESAGGGPDAKKQKTA